MWRREEALGGCNKKLVVVTGFESSGSVFAAKVVSLVLGKCSRFGEWNGYGLNGVEGDEVVVLHQSMPSRRPKLWLDSLITNIQQFKEYDVSVVVCTRDLNISKQSRMARFGGSLESYTRDDERARLALVELMSKYRSFVFGFESAVSLRDSYYQVFFEWLGVQSSFSPKVFDANKPYVKQRVVPRFRAEMRRVRDKIMQLIRSS